jgi:hypothetical protein
MTTPTELSAEQAISNLRLCVERGHGALMYPAHETQVVLLTHIDALTARIAELEAQLPDGMKDCTIQFKECERGHGRLTATNWVQHGCDACRIAELTKPVEDAEVDALVSRLKIRTHVMSGTYHEQDCHDAVKAITRLARENAALKHDIERHVTITTQQAGEIVAAEQALESARRALEEIVALPPMGQDELSLTYRLRDIAKRALAQPKVTP